jgi:thiol-activated cytolysin
MSRKLGRWGLSVVVMVGLAAACGEAPPTRQYLPEVVEAETPDDTQDIDDFVESLGHLEVEAVQPKTELPCDACPPDGQEGDAHCAYRRYTETEQFDRFVAFQPNSATLWPGAVVRGSDAEAGLLTPVGVDLAPVTFSASLENIAGSPVGQMDAPSLSSFREERNRILASDVTGATPAKLDFEMERIFEASQLSVALGAAASWPGMGDIAASFDFESVEEHTKILVNFTQAYYTIDVDTPLRPADFFAEGTSVDHLAEYVGEGNPPMYVQSITYGRRVIFAVETSASMSAVEAALAATYNGVADAAVDVATEHKEVLESAKIRAFVYGGSGADATAVINGYEGLVAYIKRGGDYTKDSPGAPIAYKLAYLDNAVTKFAFTTEYAERECVQNRGRLNVALSQIDHVGGGDGLGGKIELYGYVAVRAPVSGNGVVSCGEGGEVIAVWQLDTGQWVQFPEFTSWVPESEVSVAIDDVSMGEDQQLCIGTHIFENDDQAGELSGNDDYGYDDRLVSFDGWNATHVLQPRGAGDRAVDVHVALSLGN